MASSGCTTKSNQEIINGCREETEIGIDYALEEYCMEQACESFNLTYNGVGSWLFAEGECESHNGASIQVNFCNTNIDSCKIVCSQRIGLQNCILNNGGTIDWR